MMMVDCGDNDGDCGSVASRQSTVAMALMHYLSPFDYVMFS